MNQTISYLTKRFSETGLRLNPRHGQNFLIDLNLLRLIVQRAQLEPRDVVLEVGTGTGALTSLLAPEAGAVISVEIDPRLHQLASEELYTFRNVLLLQQDALQKKHLLDPRLVEAVTEKLAEVTGGRLKLVANLPYSVATPLVANLLRSTIVPASMTITVQKEVADRMLAAPGTRDYGALSIWVQSQCRVELVRTLAPSVFWPRPQVNSAIVHLEFDPALRSRIADLEYFHDATRRLFIHRRKFLRSVLESGWKGQLDKPAIDAILAAQDISPTLRADQLDIPTIIRLTTALALPRNDAFG